MDSVLLRSRPKPTDPSHGHGGNDGCFLILAKGPLLHFFLIGGHSAGKVLTVEDSGPAGAGSGPSPSDLPAGISTRTKAFRNGSGPQLTKPRRLFLFQR